MKLLYEKTSDEDIEEIYELCKQLIHDYEQLDTINYPKVMNWVRKRQKNQLMNILRSMRVTEKLAIITSIKMIADNLKQMICMYSLSSKIKGLVLQQ